MINDHGTVIMIDPLLEGFDMPLLIDMPIDVKRCTHVDAILVSHVITIIIQDQRVEI